jgi:hypothetical protein
LTLRFFTANNDYSTPKTRLVVNGVYAPFEYWRRGNSQPVQEERGIPAWQFWDFDYWRDYRRIFELLAKFEICRTI